MLYQAPSAVSARHRTSCFPLRLSRARGGERPSSRRKRLRTVRTMAGVRMVEGKTDTFAANAEDIGPIQEYDRRVANGLLRNDEHQRGEGPAG